MKKIIFGLFIFHFGIIASSAQTMNVVYKTINDNSADLHYTVNATYPQVDFGPDALMGVRGIAQDINNILDTTVNGMIKNFIGEVSAIPRKTFNGTESSMGITSEASVINGTLLTSQMNEFKSIAGAAHPLTTVYSFNYSTTYGGPLSISDLFSSNSDYLNYLSAECTKQLREYALKEGYTNIDDMITSGASADLKNFNTWNIKDDNLIITFNPYQVAPYVFGIQKVSIPLSNMTGMINPKGPLDFMFR